MKKIYMSIMIGMLLITLVSALVITEFNITDVILNPNDEIKSIPISEQITFDCGAVKGIVIEVSEPDGKWDDNDIQSAIRKSCSETVSNIYMNGLKYKQNKYGTKSFDETYLKSDECQKDGNYWWEEEKSCKDKSKEED